MLGPMRFKMRNRTQRSLLLLATFVLLALAAVACSDSRGDGGDFGIETYQSAGVLEGRETNYQAVLDQGKPVVLNFWGGLCPPCRAEMPVLEDAWLEYQDEIVMLGVDIGPMFRLGETSDALALIRDSGVTYPAGNSTSGSILNDYNLVGLPATFFVLPNGEIVERWSGSIRSFELGRRIDNLLEVHQESAG